MTKEGREGREGGREGGARVRRASPGCACTWWRGSRVGCVSTSTDLPDLPAGDFRRLHAAETRRARHAATVAARRRASARPDLQLRYRPAEAAQCVWQESVRVGPTHRGLVSGRRDASTSNPSSSFFSSSASTSSSSLSPSPPEMPCARAATLERGEGRVAWQWRRAHATARDKTRKCAAMRPRREGGQRTSLRSTNPK